MEDLKRFLDEIVEPTIEDFNKKSDTTTAAGRLTFHIFGAMADFERSLIRERTRAGLRRAHGAAQAAGGR